MDEKKPGIAVMIAEKLKKEPADESGEDSKEVAGLILEAIQSNDKEAFAKNLKLFIEMLS